MESLKQNRVQKHYIKYETRKMPNLQNAKKYTFQKQNFKNKFFLEILKIRKISGKPGENPVRKPATCCKIDS